MSDEFSERVKRHMEEDKGILEKLAAYDEIDFASCCNTTVPGAGGTQHCCVRPKDHGEVYHLCYCGEKWLP